MFNFLIFFVSLISLNVNAITISDPELTRRNKQTQEINFYKQDILIDNKNKDNILKIIDDDKYGGLEKFNAKAKIQINKSQISKISEIRKLPISKNFEISKDQSSEKNKLFLQSLKSINKETLIPIELNGENNNLKLNKFEKLIVDYERSSDTCLLDLSLDVTNNFYGDFNKKNSFQKWETQRNLNDNLNLKNSISPEEEIWFRKDISYLLQRELRFSPNSNWYYSENNKYDIVQRRVNWLLDEATLLKLIINYGFKVDQINLRIGFSKNFNKEKIIEFSNLSSLPSTNNTQTISLDLKEALDKNFPYEIANQRINSEINNIYLKEIILFFPIQKNNLSITKSISSVDLFGIDNHKKIEINKSSQLRYSDELLNKSTRRLSVNLDDISKSGEAKLNGALLRISSGRDTINCAIKINDVYLLGNKIQEKLFSFLEYRNNTLNTFGGPFLVNLYEDDKFETVNTIKYFPISKDVVGWPICTQLISHSKINKEHLNDSFLKKSYKHRKYFEDFYIRDEVKILRSDRVNQINFSDGATLKVENGIVNLCTNQNGLSIEGDAEFLEFSLPVKKVITSETRFFIGSDNHLSGNDYIKIILELEDGKKLYKYVEPNKSSKIIDASASIKNISVLIRPQSKEYKFLIKDLRIFEPKLLSQEETLHNKNPYFIRQIPKIILSKNSEYLSINETSGGISGFSNNDKPLEFSTILNTKINQLTGIEIKYDINTDKLTDIDWCPLFFTINGDKGSVKRKFCPKNNTGFVFIPYFKLFSLNDQDIGSLVSVNWFLLSNQNKNLEKFSLNIAFHGWINYSLYEEINDSPILIGKKNNQIIKIDKNYSNIIKSGEYTNFRWVNLEKDALRKLLSNQGNFIIATNPYFKINEIVIEPREKLDPKLWHELISNFSEKKYSSVFKFSLIFFIIFLNLVLIVIIFNNSLIKLYFITKKFIYLLNFYLKKLSQYTLRNCINKIKIINILVGLIALLPGLWFSGRYVGSYLGVVFFMFSILLIFGVLFHQRIIRFQNINILIKSLWLFAVGNIVLAFGHYGISSNTIYSLLPFLAILYIQFPDIIKNLFSYEEKLPGFILFFTLLIFLSVLYGIGLLVSNSYIFFFGDIIAIFMLRAGLLLSGKLSCLSMINLNKNVHNRDGNTYLLICIFVLCISVLFSVSGLNSIAERSATVVYYCLILAIFSEIKLSYLNKKFSAIASNKHKP